MEYKIQSPKEELLIDFKSGQKFLFIGNLGSRPGAIGGQNVRARTVLKSLIDDLKCNVFIIDMSLPKILVFFRFFYGLLIYKQIIICPGKNLLELCSRFRSIFFQKKINLIAIGGWLDSAVKNKNVYEFVKNANSVFVQTRSLLEKLKNKDIHSIYFPNYKYLAQKKSIKTNNTENKIKLAFCSRINFDKGISYLLDATKSLPSDRYILDIYGPKHGYDINAKIDGYDNIKYYGTLKSDEVSMTLSDYDIFVFPTFFKGEGFPGVLIDALFAGVPIIATNWKYNTEVLDSNCSLFVPIQDSEALASAIRLLGSDDSLRDKMSKSSKDLSRKYTPERIVPILAKGIQQ